MKDMGLETVVHINSIGTPESRANYKNALVAYFRTKKAKLSEDDKKRLLKNPLRILDSKDPAVAELKAEAPQAGPHWALAAEADARGFTASADHHDRMADRREHQRTARKAANRRRAKRGWR
jgi:histidyl-tRNA synthetase